jgi:hypothetical protein
VRFFSTATAIRRGKLQGYQLVFVFCPSTFRHLLTIHETRSRGEILREVTFQNRFICYIRVDLFYFYHKINFYEVERVAPVYLIRPELRRKWRPPHGHHNGGGGPRDEGRARVEASGVNLPLCRLF